MSSHFGGFNRSSYSTPSREHNAVVPANSQSFEYMSVEGKFRTTRLRQSDVLEIIKTDPTEIGHLSSPYDVSLAATLKSVWRAVGRMDCKTGQVGTCALISANLAILPSHCIEDMKIQELTAVFGYVNENGYTHPSYGYRVQCVVEYDPYLDYAIVQIEGAPGAFWGYLPLNSNILANSEPALLHYPLGKPLQVSVHTFVQTHYETHRLSTFHDSDFGSSGGPYISPSGAFVAMHLGSERRSYDFNLMRLALPISEIIKNQQYSILSQFACKSLNQELAYDYRYFKPILYLDPHVRNFIDFEKYFPANFQKADSSYVLRQPIKDQEGELTQPGVVIDGHQAKHSVWPAAYPGERGARFTNLSLDDVTQLAEIIVNDQSDIFNRSKPKNLMPNLIRWPVDKSVFNIPSAKELYKKIKDIKTIGIFAGFNPSSQCWEMHFFPKD